MIRSLVRRALRLLGCAALVLAAAAPSHGAQVQLPVAVVLPVQILGADAFCTGGFVAGGTASAPTLTCVTGGGPGPLTCSILGAPSGTVAPNSSVSLTMSCSGGTSPYTYLWSPVAGTAATLATNVAGNTTFTATATDSANPPATITKSATVTVGSGGGGGGGGPISCPGFNATHVIDMNWASSQIAYTTNAGGFGVNDIVVVRFTTSATTPISIAKGSIQAVEYSDPPSGRRAALSATPCDLVGLPKVGGGTNAFGPNDNAPWAYFTLVVGSGGKSGASILQLSTTYYFNITNSLPSTCQANGSCNMLITFNKPPYS